MNNSLNLSPLLRVLPMSIPKVDELHLSNKMIGCNMADKSTPNQPQRRPSGSF